MKTKFVMSKEQLNKILEASKPVRYMIFNGMEPRSPQENANDCWKELGDEMGFVWDTAEPGQIQIWHLRVLTYFAPALSGKDLDNSKRFMIKIALLLTPHASEGEANARYNNVQSWENYE